jgi:hypothetical protein
MTPRINIDALFVIMKRRKLVENSTRNVLFPSTAGVMNAWIYAPLPRTSSGYSLMELNAS